MHVKLGDRECIHIDILHVEVYILMSILGKICAKRQ